MPDKETIFLYAKTIGTTLLFSAGIQTALTWYLRTYLQNKFKKDLENYKSKLRVESELEIVKYRSQLELVTLNREIQYGHVFKQTADALVLVYKSIVATKTATQTYLYLHEGADVHQLEELSERLEYANREFSKVYTDNKIFIPRATTTLIDTFISTLRRLLKAYETHRDASRGQANLDRLDVLNAQVKLLYEKTEELLNQLENDFQKQLGLEHTK